MTSYLRLAQMKRYYSLRVLTIRKDLIPFILRTCSSDRSPLLHSSEKLGEVREKVDAERGRSWRELSGLFHCVLSHGTAVL